ncbi:MAG: hypothetical protein Fur0046_30240 [Cyanobacteria bacterium J069]|nr:MAG: CIA30 family protein [Cyanobacteria bacterium J069]
MSSTLTLFDFTQPQPDLAAIWGALNDGVMGGVSQSQFRQVGAAGVFSGNVSTANAGGFASVRTRDWQPPLDLTGYIGIELRLRGDGHRYKLFLRPEDRWDGLAFCSSFDTERDRWLTVQLPFVHFVPVVRAKTVSGVALDFSRIYALQLMLSKFELDGMLNPHFAPGPFQLQIEAIAAYR